MQLVSFDDLMSKPNQFLGDVNNLVIATYGKIYGFDDGQHTYASKSGKSVKVLVGGGMFNGVNFFGFSLPDPNPGLVQATKDAGLEAVKKEMSEVAGETFVVLYAGTSRLDKVVDLGASLAEKGAKVALLSCGCDRPARFARVDQVSGANNIIVVMPDHPGRCDSEAGDLADLAAKFMEL